MRYGLEYRQFNTGWDFYQRAGKASYAFDLDFQVNYLSAIVGIEDGIWVRKNFSLSTQFALIPSYQVANRVSGDHGYVKWEDHKSEKIADFHLGIRPGLLFQYRLSP